MYSTASQDTAGKFAGEVGSSHELIQNLEYRLVDIDSDEDADVLAAWYNDARIRHFAFQHRDADAYDFIATRKSVRKKMAACRDPNFRMYFVLIDGRPIGQFSLQKNARPVQKLKDISAWVGLMIGEQKYRGMGLGKQIVREIETRALTMGFQRIELGVYEFNVQARGLYKYMRYEEFVTVPKQTWWNGRNWGSVHMEKWIIEHSFENH